MNSQVGTQPESSGTMGVTSGMMGNLRAAFEALHANVALLKQGFILQPQQGVVDHAAEDISGRLKGSKPIKFEQNRSPKDLENFIWDRQEYFTAAKIPEERQVSMTSMFLMREAKL